MISSQFQGPYVTITNDYNVEIPARTCLLSSRFLHPASPLDVSWISQNAHTQNWALGLALQTTCSPSCLTDALYSFRCPGPKPWRYPWFPFPSNIVQYTGKYCWFHPQMYPRICLLPISSSTALAQTSIITSWIAATVFQWVFLFPPLATQQPILNTAARDSLKPKQVTLALLLRALQGFCIQWE